MTVCIQPVRMIGVTALHGAGKGTLAQFLVSHGFKHFSAREHVLWPEVNRRKLPRDRDSLHLVANELRQKHGADYVTRKLVEDGLASGVNTVVESFYTPGEIAHARTEAAKRNTKRLLHLIRHSTISVHVMSWPIW